MQPRGGSHGSAGVLGGATLCLLLSAGYLLSQVQADPQVATIHVETKQVLVPVIVKDRKGHYLTNLTSADFRIYDDGAEQKIVAFITPAGGASTYFQPQVVELGLPLPETLTPPSESAGLPPNTYLICLDTLNSAFSDYALVRRALEKLFRELGPSDARYALVTLGRQARVVRNLTRDPAAILAALDEREFKGAISQSETIRRTEEESQLTQMLRRYCESCDCASGQDPESGKGGSCPGEWGSLEGWASAQAAQRRMSTLDFLNNLRGLVERLGEVPGKRTIILVSDGFNIQPGRELYGLMAAFSHAQGVLLHNPEQYMEPEVQSVVRAAQMRDVSFYTVDSRGLYNVFASEINQTELMAPFPRISLAPPRTEHLGETLAKMRSERQTMASENQAALQEFAADTGGDFFHNSNDYLKGLRQALDDGEAYYLLAYTPTHLIADGKFHKIKVEVGEPNVAVRAKKGYFAPAAGEAVPVTSAPPVPSEGAKPTMNTLPSPPAGAAISHEARDTGALSPPDSHAATPQASRDQSPHLDATERLSEHQPAPVLMVDWPVARLMHAIPQLKELQPIESQEEMAGILGKVGENVGAFAQSVINLASNEEITEEQLRPNGKVSKQFKEKFEYLVVAEKGSNGMTLREYRTDSGGKPVKPMGLTKGYMVTSGDFSAALCFLPNLQSGSSFRFLGEQILDGRKTYVIVFAQRSGSSGQVGLLLNATGDKSVAAILQGIAWIDSANYQIARLRTDVFPPPSDATLWKLTSDIHYHEVHSQQPTSSLWVPDNVVVTMSLADRMWRDEHHYSGFRVFTVNSKLSSEPSRQAN